jgi:NitT/TauT family transport system substrate-binding protein
MAAGAWSVIAGNGGAVLARGAAAANTTSTSASVRLGFVGNPCEAATYAAPHSAAFTRYRLGPQLIRFDDEAALLAALGAGRVDAASVRLPDLVTALEAGRNVRAVAGLHAGCLRVLARDAVTINAITDLKGQTIATDRLRGSAMNLLSAILHRQGVDPLRDVSWRAYAVPDLEAALDAKSVGCVAAADPLGYFILNDHKAEPYLDTADGGGFSCGGDIAAGHHCFLVLHGGLVASRPALAASVTRAYLASTAAIGAGAGPAGVATIRGHFVDDGIEDVVGMLASYDWRASTDLVQEELELTARDFRRAGLLRATTDPGELAERGFADVLHG